MPLLAFRARLKPVGIEVFDNFNRPDGSLGMTSDGSANWASIAGTWQVKNNQAFTSTAASANPIAAVAVPYSDIDMSCSISPTGNDALYFRIVDANNWLRLKLREYTTSYSYTQYCTYTSYDYQCGNAYGGCDAPGCGSCPGACSVHLSSGGLVNCTGGACINMGTCTQACGTGTGYTYNYYLDTEKCVAGTVSSVGTVSLGASVSVSSIRVYTQGSSIQVFTNGTSQATYTDSTNVSATTHGIGRGLSNSSTNDGSALDNFSLKSAA